MLSATTRARLRHAPVRSLPQRPAAPRQRRRPQEPRLPCASRLSCLPCRLYPRAPGPSRLRGSLDDGYGAVSRLALGKWQAAGCKANGGSSMKPRVGNTGGITYVNAFKMEMTGVNGKPLPVSGRQPLRSWPACPHPEQARLDFYRQIPSRTS